MNKVISFDRREVIRQKLLWEHRLIRNPTNSYIPYHKTFGGNFTWKTEELAKQPAWALLQSIFAVRYKPRRGGIFSVSLIEVSVIHQHHFEIEDLYMCLVRVKKEGSDPPTLTVHSGNLESILDFKWATEDKWNTRSVPSVVWDYVRMLANSSFSHRPLVAELDFDS